MVRYWSIGKTFFLVSVVSLSGLVLLAEANAESSAEIRCDAEPDFWVVDTRTMTSSCVGLLEEASPTIRQFDDCGRGNTVEMETFFNSVDPSIPLVVFVHGNQVDRGWAIRQGRQLFRILRRACPESRFRFVVWSWPSKKISGPIRRDIQIKARRSDAQASYLAQWIDRLPEGMNVGMVGYSFGARMIGGATQMLAGGCYRGRVLLRQNGSTEVPETPLRQYRLALIASASDVCWLMPGHSQGLIDDWAQDVLITVNRHDRVLKWYPLMQRGNRAKALGHVGPPRSVLRCGPGTIQTINVSGSVGCSHDLDRYLCSCRLRQLLPWYTFLQEGTSDNVDTDDADTDDASAPTLAPSQE